MLVLADQGARVLGLEESHVVQLGQYAILYVSHPQVLAGDLLHALSGNEQEIEAVSGLWIVQQVHSQMLGVLTTGEDLLDYLAPEMLFDLSVFHLVASSQDARK